MEATAPTDIAEVSRRARGSTLKPVHPSLAWASRTLDAIGIAGYAGTQSATVFVLAHVEAKLTEALSLSYSSAADNLDKLTKDGPDDHDSWV